MTAACPPPDLPGTQIVRILDVFALGPLLIFAGGRRSGLSAPVRGTLVFSGITTILWNGINLIRHAR